jgi:hypothetical protein
MCTSASKKVGKNNSPYILYIYCLVLFASFRLFLGRKRNEECDGRKMKRFKGRFRLQCDASEWLKLTTSTKGVNIFASFGTPKGQLGLQQTNSLTERRAFQFMAWKSTGLWTRIGPK